MSALSETISERFATSPSGLKNDLKDLLDATPGLAGLGLFVELQEKPGKHIAYTDGRVLVVGPKYAKLPQIERRGVLAHELLHVGLAHPLRGKRLRTNTNDYDHELFNVACDAIVNYAVRAIPRLELPANCVDIKQLEQVSGLSLTSRSVEQIYAVLKNHRDKNHNTTLSDSKTNADPLAGDVEDIVDDFIPDADNENIEQWGYRTTAAAGSIPGLAERLRGDLPKVTTPWNAILRSFTRRFCGVNLERDYRRPHRRWLSTQPLACANKLIVPIHYGTKRCPAGRLAIAVDTSGSIDEALLGRFTAEIVSLMKQTGAQVRLLVADAAVHQVVDFVGTTGIAQLQKFVYAGGGGTNFGPAIAQAAEWNPDALIYLTDLYGDCGPKPKFPVLWAICPGESPKTPPFGQRIDLV